MEPVEYRKLAEVEDRMWYFAALHGHVERALEAGLAREGHGRLARVSRHTGETPVPPQTAQILDAGCGTGGLIRRLSARHRDWRWTGVDVEPLAVELAGERTRGANGGGATDATIVAASITALPFPAESFDAVVSADVLYHVDDDAAALRQFFRVLRPGGFAVINVPAYRWLWSYHDEAVHSRRRYARAEVAAKLRAAGFADVRTTHWNALPLPLVIARRKLFAAPAGGSDVGLFPAPIEAAFRGAMALERAWLERMGSIAFGSSIFAVAWKPLR